MKTPLSTLVLVSLISLPLTLLAEESSLWQGIKEDAKQAWSETKQTGKNIGKEASEDASEGWDKAKQGVGNPKPAWQEFKHDIKHPKKQQYDGTSQ
ncbi:MAG: hypothetical protein RBS36_11755 [Thiomicrospira sp.]|jgi:hypothetical protein|nr:hypothetical protein [Thiomicrospira sp.]